jgi:hypothetical protein
MPARRISLAELAAAFGSATAHRSIAGSVAMSHCAHGAGPVFHLDAAATVYYR